MLFFGYKGELMLSIMADTGKMESVEEVKIFGKFISEEMKNLQKALLAECEKHKAVKVSIELS